MGRLDRVEAGTGEHRHAFTAMASRCEICLAGTDAALARSWSLRAQHEVARIESKYSRYRDDSVIGTINRAAGSGVLIEVDAETQALLDFGAALHARSAGRFDLTSGVLRRAWDFRSARLPTPEALEAARACVGWEKLRREAQGVALLQPGMELDFGGIGKEYAADRAAALLIEAGARHGFVNLGGDLRVLGPQPDGRPWRFGIQHPRELRRMIAEVALAEGALATSGDYERYFELDGRRYCHLLDATTGWPVETWQSASVVAPVCAAAGALATLAMLAGEAAPHGLDTEGVAWALVDAQGQLHRVANDASARISDIPRAPVPTPRNPTNMESL